MLVFTYLLCVINTDYLHGPRLSELKAKQQTFGRQSYTSCPELFASEGIHEPQFIDSSSDEEFALPAHFKLTLAEKPSSGVECHRRLRRRREVLAQEEDYNTLAADDDDEEGGDQKLDVPSEFNRLFAKFKRVSPSTDYNSTSNSDHSFPGRPSSNSDYSILYGKVCCMIISNPDAPEILKILYAHVTCML